MPDFDSNKGAEWPYPVGYGRENAVDADADILILGGRVAGSHAAINGAKRGAKMMVVGKGAVVGSGCCGAGVDPCTVPINQVR